MLINTMTFRTWSLIAKPGNQTFEGMMHTAKCRRILQKWYTAWIIIVPAWCYDLYCEDKRNRELEDSVGYNLRRHWYGDTE